MTNLPGIALIFFQEGRPAAEPSFNLEGYIWIVAAAVLGFLGGSLLTAIFFLTKTRQKDPGAFKNQPVYDLNERKVSIKHCSKCNSTYTDEDLGYCLRDGTLLKIVGTMPLSEDPDQTVYIPSNR